ncbi:hypothetical protein MMC22_002118 [Lobaria immixta]|nr:hypothetical protein [Lobaria immixta]
MDIPAQIDPISSDINIHPFKRRKFYRKRGEADNPATIDDINSETNKDVDAAGSLAIEGLLSHQGQSQDVVEHGREEGSRLPTAQILRQRKAAQRRRGGIEFTNASNTRISAATSENCDALIEKDDSIQDMKTVVDRFAPQTGQVADVDKHMMAYIESGLAKRRQGHDTSTSNGEGSEGNLSLNGTLINAGLHRQPAALGKLHEIDLGPDAKLRNIARTEAAKKRLEGGEEAEVDEKGTGKVRLRRDGKPWRGRRRRNSEDIKRDKLVEEVMRESRLEIYDEPEPDLATDDQAADDRIAEQFRRDFLDAISSRRQRSSAAARAAKKAKANGTKVDDRPRGPKLGGSRSARAAMRELQEKARK